MDRVATAHPAIRRLEIEGQPVTDRSEWRRRFDLPVGSIQPDHPDHGDRSQPCTRKQMVAGTPSRAMEMTVASRFSAAVGRGIL